jgi:hypothetical protein
MALTLETDQRLAAVGLTAFFDKGANAWRGLAGDTMAFVAGHFPKGAKVRCDDVAKELVPILEVHAQFRDYLDEHKLRGKFWIRDFADLIIDRTWDEISKAAP